jgi:hypothetical protein
MKGEVRAFAPATVANVSCGFDILGFAIDTLGDVVRVKEKKEPGIQVVSITGDQGRLPLDPTKNTCAVAVQALLTELNQTIGLEIYLEKGLPLVQVWAQVQQVPWQHWWLQTGSLMIHLRKNNYSPLPWLQKKLLVG